MEDPLLEAPELSKDDRSDNGFVKWFKALSQDSTLVRFFDRKDFYSVHGENALFIARTFYKTTAVVKYMGGSATGLPGVTLNKNLFETALRHLLVESAEYSVQMFEGSGTQWRKTRQASPGKLGAFEEELFRNVDMTDVPVAAALLLGYTEGARTVGIAFADAAGRRLGACEFADDEYFCSTEAVLLQLGAKEVVLPKENDAAAQSADAGRLRDVVARCNALGSERPRVVFGTRNLEQDLGRLLRSGNVEQHRDVLERPLASAALAAVIAFSEVMAVDSGHGKWGLALYDTGRYMRLDVAAQRALNVMKQRTDANDSFSLYGLMNKGRTAMAKRLLKVWLKQPLVDLTEITERHDIVEAFAEDPTLRERLRNLHLRGLPDIERLTRKLERKKATLADLCQLYRASSRLPMMEEAFRDHDGPHAQLLATRYADKLAAAHDDEHLAKFEELLEAAIDLDRIPDEYLICASYDSDLQGLREEKDKVEATINKLAEDAADDLGLIMDKTIKLEWHKVANTRTRCLRITQTEEKKVRKKLQSGRYMTLETRKDGTKFTNRQLKEAAERLQAISRSYDQRQHALVEQVVSVAATFAEVWEGVAGMVAEMDLLAGFAELAMCAPLPYVRPTMLPADASELKLTACRHPCVEAQDGVEFIANDCHMERGKSWFQVITGPNMAGKSTYIRQVGVAVLMAQVGCFVACEHARIAVRDCIFARVGAGDCQLRGISTFMAEMLETAAILKGASSKSLVIIDELGRGTSTYDGFGLAWAISEHLMQEIGCPTLFATHFHELTALQGPVGVANKHVETAIDEASGKLTMLYQVTEGACDQSFGIHVAEFARFPPEVVELAKRKAAELEDFSAPAQGFGQDAKRACTDEEEAAQSAARARAFLQEFSALPLDKMEPEEATAQAQALYKQLLADAARMPTLQRLLEG
ncbi:hypothetical protein WJX75_005715 [Coccomyxa subellipsoidea]|uniref:DNA mismatch repair proteins mutS family domain-containing protein n=1 Tax=Coccomyxa subellipsoidea TaxID=248742 RepID=A0ABR2YNW8_9CHLO